MNFTPPRGLGISIGSIMLLLLLGTSALAIAQLATSTFSSLTALWVLIPLISLPLAIIIAYYLYGLATARYRLDRNGFYIHWGITSVQIPLADISNILRTRELDADQVLSKGMTWPGCLTGRRMIDSVGRVDFFATRGADGLLLVGSGGGSTREPAWCANLRAHPEVECVRSGRIEACHATELEGETRAAAWRSACGIYPGYRRYQQRLAWRIAVFRLTPVSGDRSAGPQR